MYISILAVCRNNLVDRVAERSDLLKGRTFPTPSLRLAVVLLTLAECVNEILNVLLSI
jgi:hypothetical protein